MCVVFINQMCLISFIFMLFVLWILVNYLVFPFYNKSCVINVNDVLAFLSFFFTTFSLLFYYPKWGEVYSSLMRCEVQVLQIWPFCFSLLSPHWEMHYHHKKGENVDLCVCRYCQGDPKWWSLLISKLLSTIWF